jgi:hypothetical protein
MIGYLGTYLLSITPDRPMAPAEKTARPFAVLFAPPRAELPAADHLPLIVEFRR